MSNSHLQSLLDLMRCNQGNSKPTSTKPNISRYHRRSVDLNESMDFEHVENEKPWPSNRGEWTSTMLDSSLRFVDADSTDTGPLHRRRSYGTSQVSASPLPDNFIRSSGFIANSFDDEKPYTADTITPPFGDTFGDQKESFPQRSLQQLKEDVPKRQHIVTSTSSPFFASSSHVSSPQKRHLSHHATEVPRWQYQKKKSRVLEKEKFDYSGLPAQFYFYHTDAKANESVVKGIKLVPVARLPARLQSIFPFRAFNAVQSKCYSKVFGSDGNFVLSSPTGSGKTVVMELAICRLFEMCADKHFKSVYMAPTKALCSERATDWSAKFLSLGLVCTEITGDTTLIDSITQIQDADIVITTPEKWDSMTRKWKDHRQSMTLVKLLLIDEVHILGDTRGATLEVVVSRMKSIGSSVRIIALSATIPNIADIADWLGRSQSQTEIPAELETFGEEFRPVQLERHVFELRETGSGFSIDSACTRYIPDIISKHAKQEPILIFCFTKRSCEATAQYLKECRQNDRRAESWWPRPQVPLQAESADVSSLYAEGIAVHCSDLHPQERIAVESGFLNGQLSVICSTSTLAVGVNLPCHLVIIKNTIAYGEEGLREYSDLEVMQMLGRAGRPQFNSSGAVAVIMTQSSKAERYKRLVSGQELVESKLHSNLIEHMNAEICLGTIKSAVSAQEWLKGTFLAVRLRKNPSYYRLGTRGHTSTFDSCIAGICKKDISALVQGHLAYQFQDQRIKSSAFGEAMARYYIQFPTMKTFLSLGRGSTIPEILTAISEAKEFSSIKLRQSEKPRYEAYNSIRSVRFPISEVATSSQKVYVIIQIELSRLRPPHDSKGKRPDRQYLQDRAIIFNNIHRLIRCVVDCQAYLQDAVVVKNGLELARSCSSKMWDESPMQLQLLPGIGPVTSRKLVASNITTIESLSKSDPAKIGMVTGKRAAAEKIYQESRSYPLLAISIGLHGQRVVSGSLFMSIEVKAEFENRRIPDLYKDRPVFVCVVTERSDQTLVDFRRIKASKVCEPILLDVEMTRPDQHVTSYVVCDELIGTMKSATLRPEIEDHMSEYLLSNIGSSDQPTPCKILKNSSKICSHSQIACDGSKPSSDFLELVRSEEIDDADMIAAEQAAYFTPIEEIERRAEEPSQIEHRSDLAEKTHKYYDRRRSDGKYECNHNCKDKTRCKHMCCRDGLVKPPRPGKG